MNAKNLNPLERHVEKIVLAVAVAGAAVIGYFGTIPVTVPNTEVKAGDVEAAVSSAVAHLDDVRTATAKRTDITPRLADYIREYKTLMSDAPLKPDMIAATAVPLFAPMQQPVGAGGAGDLPDTHEMQVVTPVVPPPKDLKATSSRASVAIVTPDAAPATPPAPGTVPPNAKIQDLNWVTITGHIPMADYIAAMNNPALQANQKLAPGVQHAVLYRVEVQRRTRTGGNMSAWEPVPPTKANGPMIDIDWPTIADADMNSTVNALDAAFQKVAEPDFYTYANGQAIIPSIIAKPDASTTKPAAVAPTAAAPAPTAGRGRTDIDAPDETAAAAVAPPAAPGGMPALAPLRQLPNIPFWFYDENVAPGQEYQYQVRLVMFNPTYRFPLGLQNPAMKNQPTIASEWVPVPGTVNVNSDLYFFVDSGIGAARIAPPPPKSAFASSNGPMATGTAPKPTPSPECPSLEPSGSSTRPTAPSKSPPDIPSSTSSPAAAASCAPFSSPPPAIWSRAIPLPIAPALIPSAGPRAPGHQTGNTSARAQENPRPYSAARPRQHAPDRSSTVTPAPCPHIFLLTHPSEKNSWSDFYLSRSSHSPDFQKKPLRPRIAALSMFPCYTPA